MKNANELNILNFNFSKDKLIHDYDLEYENNATFKKIASSLDLPKDTLIKETSKIIESSIEVDRCKKCKHLFECKNNVVICFNDCILVKSKFSPVIFS